MMINFFFFFFSSFLELAGGSWGFWSVYLIRVNKVTLNPSYLFSFVYKFNEQSKTVHFKPLLLWLLLKECHSSYVMSDHP